jgi:hypothetical protein
MTRKWIFLIAAAVVGTGFLAVTAFAYGGHRHHRLSAMGLCLSVMSPTQRANLRSTLAEREGFEPSVPVAQYARLAIRTGGFTA